MRSLKNHEFIFNELAELKVLQRRLTFMVVYIIMVDLENLLNLK